MTYVIAEPCIGTKDNSCVEVCPVDCIHPTPDEPGYDEVEMLYIDPEECIDCDACVEACPVDAIFAEDQLPDEWQKYSRSTPPTTSAEPSLAGGFGFRPMKAGQRLFDVSARCLRRLARANTTGNPSGAYAAAWLPARDCSNSVSVWALIVSSSSILSDRLVG